MVVPWIRSRRNLEPPEPSLLAAMVAMLVVVAFFAGAITLFLFTARLLSRPYQGFSLVIVRDAQAAAGMRMTLEERWHVVFFLWWRQLAAGLISMVMALPLNALLFIMGIRITSEIGYTAGIFVIGPILIKMLVGHQFKGFRLEAQHAATAL